MNFVPFLWVGRSFLEADDFLKTGTQKKPMGFFSETSNRSFQNPFATVHWSEAIPENVSRAWPSGLRELEHGISS